VFIFQENILTGVLTVRENVMFSAQLRLSRKMSYDEKVRKVNKLINELGLDDCCDTKVHTCDRNVRFMLVMYCSGWNYIKTWDIWWREEEN